MANDFNIHAGYTRLVNALVAVVKSLLQTSFSKMVPSSSSLGSTILSRSEYAQIYKLCGRHATPSSGLIVAVPASRPAAQAVKRTYRCMPSCGLTDKLQGWHVTPSSGLIVTVPVSRPAAQAVQRTYRRMPSSGLTAYALTPSSGLTPSGILHKPSSGLTVLCPHAVQRTYSIRHSSHAVQRSYSANALTPSSGLTASGIHGPSNRPAALQEGQWHAEHA